VSFDDLLLLGDRLDHSIYGIQKLALISFGKPLILGLVFGTSFFFRLCWKFYLHCLLVLYVLTVIRIMWVR